VTIAGAAAPRVRALLLDIEGTTTPISFVYDVLFPHARRHLDEYLAARAGSAALATIVAMLRDEWSADQVRGEIENVAKPSLDDVASVASHLTWLMDRDRKSPALKRVQGEIWETGYRNGELRAQVFNDVPPAFARWSSADMTLAIYSSGSVLAQRLLFGHSEMGDLTPFIDQYFDTAVGAKRASESYERIARVLAATPAEVLFISDVDQELDAATRAGMRVLMCARPGNAVQRSSVGPTIRSFDEVDTVF
jgi:enolase-phosphatase E1